MTTALDFFNFLFILIRDSHYCAAIGTFDPLALLSVSDTQRFVAGEALERNGHLRFIPHDDEFSSRLVRWKKRIK